MIESGTFQKIKPKIFAFAIHYLQCYSYHSKISFEDSNEKVISYYNFRFKK